MSVEIAREDAPPREFVDGLRDSVPVVVAAMPFGLLFGALAVENGFTTFEVVLMSATIFAGASQMVGIDLFGQKVAPWLIVLSIFAVNFRHVLYSATTGRRIAHWGPVQRLMGFFLLADPVFAEAERRGETHGKITFGWYMGSALPLYLCWVAEGWVGALFGNLVPDPQALGIDFLLPIYFLGLVMSFRKRSFWLPVVLMSAVVSVIAYRTVGSPWHVSIGAIAGVALAAAVAPGTRAGKEKS
ncbi:AzlC family ABC transporter permease [Nitratireductor aquimarinus]|uniref:AzlC family ABC transporter permease n=1 Tax=Nitratireductor aquimarinus TaxID=889300 RepID=A0ABU4AFG2_9HYPH|nr:AzlC family ABC transporter permease [Nitratireductor aquimarinus]MDV6224982.1 AzlC family ABC transporter permease [Nitratireductor aquimarinus]